MGEQGALKPERGVPTREGAWVAGQPRDRGWGRRGPPREVGPTRQPRAAEWRPPSTRVRPGLRNMSFFRNGAFVEVIVVTSRVEVTLLCSSRQVPNQGQVSLPGTEDVATNAGTLEPRNPARAGRTLPGSFPRRVQPCPGFDLGLLVSRLERGGGAHLSGLESLGLWDLVTAAPGAWYAVSSVPRTGPPHGLVHSFIHTETTGPTRRGHTMPRRPLTGSVPCDSEKLVWLLASPQPRCGVTGTGTDMTQCRDQDRPSLQPSPPGGSPWRHPLPRPAQIGSLGAGLAPPPRRGERSQDWGAGREQPPGAVTTRHPGFKAPSRAAVLLSWSCLSEPRQEHSP